MIFRIHTDFYLCSYHIDKRSQYSTIAMIIMVSMLYHNREDGYRENKD